LYVASGNNNNVQRFNGTNGTFLDSFVPTGTGGLNLPIGLLFGPDANLYVASFNNKKVARFSWTTGAYLGDFVTNGSGGLSGPNFMLFRPKGSLSSPKLSIARAGTNVVLSWETNAVGFHLQERSTVTSNAVWVDLTNSSGADSNMVQIPIRTNNSFFRLKNP
jgi:DNA-binding beta-propeller fold protein YncE